MDYTKEDLKVFKHRDIKPEQIDRQLANFEKGFDYVDLSEPATIGNGIIRIEAEDEERLNANFDKARQECELLKMVPASGSATRMFKDLFTLKRFIYSSETVKCKRAIFPLLQYIPPSTICSSKAVLTKSR